MIVLADLVQLDLQHHLFVMTFDESLYTCPAGKDKPLNRVLDAGTGTGIWATDFGTLQAYNISKMRYQLTFPADDHPETHVRHTS